MTRPLPVASVDPGDQDSEGSEAESDNVERYPVVWESGTGTPKATQPLPDTPGASEAYRLNASLQDTIKNLGDHLDAVNDQRLMKGGNLNIMLRKCRRPSRSKKGT